MSKYINKEYLLTELEEDLSVWDTESKREFPRWQGMKRAIIYVKDMPEIEIVHCRECKHCVTAPSGILCCGLLHGLVKMTEDSFCSYAERKDAE